MIGASGSLADFAGKNADDGAGLDGFGGVEAGQPFAVVTAAGGVSDTMRAIGFDAADDIRYSFSTGKESDEVVGAAGAGDSGADLDGEDVGVVRGIGILDEGNVVGDGGIAAVFA